MRGPWPRGVGLYGTLGSVLAVAGGFLPWLTLGGRTVSAWQIPVLSLFGRGQVGPPAGALLLLPLLALLPYVIRRPLPLVARLLLAIVATNLASALIVQELRHSPVVLPGIGVLLTMAGGILMLLGDAGSRAVRRA